jgi:hypothetical protein
MASDILSQMTEILEDQNARRRVLLARLQDQALSQNERFAAALEIVGLPLNVRVSDYVEPGSMVLDIENKILFCAQDTFEALKTTVPDSSVLHEYAPGDPPNGYQPRFSFYLHPRAYLNG